MRCRFLILRLDNQTRRRLSPRHKNTLLLGKSGFCLYGLSCVFPFLASYKTIIHATQDKSTTCAAELPVKGEKMANWNFD